MHIPVHVYMYTKCIHLISILNILFYHMTSLLFSHEHRMTTRVITLWRGHVTSLMSVSVMRFLIEIKYILMAIKSHF